MSDPAMIENHTYDEITVGESASVTRTLSREDIELFGFVSGDANFTDYEGDQASERFPHATAHGMWSAGLISTVLGSVLPGLGTNYVSQNLRFARPIAIGDTITATVTVKEKQPARRRVVLACRCVNQAGEEVVTGEAEVEAPAEKVHRAPAVIPDVRISSHDRYRKLIERSARGAAVATAVVHPCSAAAITAAVDGFEAGLIRPILVGPEARMRDAAREAGKDISAFRIVSAPHSHAAAETAVALIRAGEAQLLMKGSLHTDELMGAVVPRATGLRTERRISHVYIMDVPGHSSLMFITDAAINIEPTLDEKADIIRNAIDLAHVLGIETPRVAILSAVETVNPEIRSTLDAAALCKMADRGQITGAILDGPLAFDNAVSEAAAREKGIVSPVAGKADILVVPNLEAGNMLAKQLIFLGGADAAGIVLGARVPIILTSRADSLRTRLASCAVAVSMVRAATMAAPGPAEAA
ncbi:bifunctional enoyl-CoA hydratase/phosphate acetyltransferase [Sphingomonas sp. MMS24-J13]|uniref:bifunctional enoyl-CoA hydratase/phosphate acetyltransferase n=1 Tax=Sphingomonas sp. MMS24-J13 TaxID=3238686 RepID=UPI0038503BF8